MSDTIQLTLWTGVHLYEETVVLNDESHLEFISRAHEIFRPYSLSGSIHESSPEIHRVVRELIAAGDFVYLEPALYARHFQGRNWDGVSVSDGAFVLQCFPWTTSEEWLSFMPWMIEFVLRADHCVESVESFLYFLTPSNVPHGRAWTDLLSPDASAVVVAFLDRLYAKYTDEMGSLESYGDGYHLLVNVLELRDAWARRVPPG